MPAINIKDGGSGKAILAQFQASILDKLNVIDEAGVLLAQPVKIEGDTAIYQVTKAGTVEDYQTARNAGYKGDPASYKRLEVTIATKKEITRELEVWDELQFGYGSLGEQYTKDIAKTFNLFRVKVAMDTLVAASTAVTPTGGGTAIDAFRELTLKLLNLETPHIKGVRDEDIVVYVSHEQASSLRKYIDPIVDGSIGYKLLGTIDGIKVVQVNKAQIGGHAMIATLTESLAFPKKVTKIDSAALPYTSATGFWMNFIYGAAVLFPDAVFHIASVV